MDQFEMSLKSLVNERDSQPPQVSLTIVSDLLCPYELLSMFYWWVCDLPRKSLFLLERLEGYWLSAPIELLLKLLSNAYDRMTIFFVFLVQGICKKDSFSVITIAIAIFNVYYRGFM